MTQMNAMEVPEVGADFEPVKLDIPKMKYLLKWKLVEFVTAMLLSMRPLCPVSHNSFFLIQGIRRLRFVINHQSRT